MYGYKHGNKMIGCIIFPLKISIESCVAFFRVFCFFCLCKGRNYANKNAQHEAAHEKHTTPIAATQLSILTIGMRKKSMRFFQGIICTPFAVSYSVVSQVYYTTEKQILQVVNDKNKKCAYRSRRTKTQTPIVAKLTFAKSV